MAITNTDHSSWDSSDWLLVLYILKWSHICKSPHWLFITLWIIVIFKILYLLSKEDYHGKQTI